MIATTTNLRAVVNKTIDLTLNDRGNMRVWEAMAGRATLVGDREKHPDHLNRGREFADYSTLPEILTNRPSLLRMMTVSFQFLRLAINRFANFIRNIGN